MTAVRATGLVKRYGDTIAVDGLDLDVPEGSFFGIAGPNGAGKTTTLRMLVTLVRPDAGGVEVAGVDAVADPIGARGVFGFVPDEPALLDRLTGREVLQYTGLLRGLDAATVRARSGELLDVLGLADDAERLVGDYSLGMTRKVALAAALLHGPRVLFLDEPFGAVDPVSMSVVEEILQRFTAGGGTVVFSSHVMDVVERLCDRLAVIVDGQVLASGTVAEIAGPDRLHDAFVRLVGGRSLEAGGLEWLDRSSG
jgi:ABC-2 type transport system ATP-binding protein